MRKNNKKILAITILTACMLILGACGKSAQQTTAEIDTNPVTEDTFIEEETAGEANEIEIETKDDAPTNDSIGTVDVIVGGDVISVNDISNEKRDFNLSALPEIHILIPSGDVACSVEDGDTAHFRQYEITVPDSNHTIYCRVNLNGQKDCYCGAKHEETMKFGIYTLDYNWCQFAIYNEATDTAIVIGFEAADEHTSETSDYVAALTDANIEYIKEQVSSWDQNFVPDVAENTIDDADVSGTSDNDGLLECDIIPCGFYDLDGNKYVMVSTYDDDDSGECMLMFGRYDGADSPFDYYDLENVANNTYSATNWDKVSVTVTFSDGGMDLSGGTGELEEYNGHYTLQ